MFRIFVTGLLIGLVFFYQLKALPDWIELLALTFILSLIHLGCLKTGLYQRTSARQITRIIITLLWGGLFAFWWGLCHFYLTPVLPQDFLETKVELTGEIVELPQYDQTLSGKNKVSLFLKVDSLQTNNQSQNWSLIRPKVRINWYSNHSFPQLSPGDTWHFTAKLKTIHTSMNPGGFDYESYQFQNGVQASGYVLDQKAKLIEPAMFSVRGKLAEKLTDFFKQSPFVGIYQALIIGDRQLISEAQWQVLRTTGTIHLMAISGLHISIAAGMGFLLFSLIWRFAILWFRIRWLMHLPKIQFAAIGALIFASLYATLAGFSIPTQRAWLMVLAMFAFVFLRRKFQPWSALALAAFMILLWEPKSVLASGFWLSFLAVSIIFAVVNQPSFSKKKKWLQLIWVQWWLTVGLIPVLAFIYLQVPTLSLMANLIAVPFVSFIALPLLILTFIFTLLFPDFSGFLASLNDFLWSSLWQYLQTLSSYAYSNWLTGDISIWQLLLSYVIFFSIVLLVPFNHFIKSVLTLLAFTVVLSLSSVESINPGEFKLSVMDVGQGEAIVFQTASHTVVYDTGAKWTNQLDGTKMALLPYFRHQKIQQIDLLIVSHSDQDHAGGMASLLEKMPVKQAFSGQAEVLNQRAGKAVFKPCYTGQKWQLDGITFEMLSPDRGQSAANDNDTSCVLKVTSGSQSVLVPGDASAKIEGKLVSEFSNLKSSILIAGHHGSQSSSSEMFLKAVAPDLVIFSAGFNNRYGFPNKEVVQRVEKLDTKWLNTACSGSVHIFFTNKSFELKRLSRRENRHWYHHPCPK